MIVLIVIFDNGDLFILVKLFLLFIFLIIFFSFRLSTDLSHKQVQIM